MGSQSCRTHAAAFEPEHERQIDAVLRRIAIAMGGAAIAGIPFALRR